MKELREINILLSNIEGSNEPGEVFVDNLHSPYIKFKEKFILPKSASLGPDINSIQNFVQILRKFLPEAIEGTCLLPAPRPKRETGKLFFVRPILFENKQYLYVFSTDMQYLGGATPQEIKIPAAQNLTPSVETDRIYFQVKIFPIESLVEENGYISDFQAVRFRGGNFRVEADRESDKGPQRYSEIFDEIDFSNVEAKIRIDLGINDEIWPMGKVYSPVGVDYLSISLRFLEPSLPRVIREFKNFYGILNPGEEGIDEGTRRALHKYLFKHETSRTQSRSGNMLWKIHFTDFDHRTE